MVGWVSSMSNCSFCSYQQRQCSDWCFVNVRIVFQSLVKESLESAGELMEGQLHQLLCIFDHLLCLARQIEEMFPSYRADSRWPSTCSEDRRG